MSASSMAMLAMDGPYTGGKVIAATTVALFFSITAVTLRTIARAVQRMPVMLEDIVIFIGLVFKIGTDAAGIILLKNGMGQHVNQLSASQLATFAKAQYSGSYLYPLCITFVKLSILFQYRRFFAFHSRAFIMQVNVMIGLVVVWCCAIIITAGFLCMPIQKLWEPELPGTCLNLVGFYYGLQIPNIITDVLIIVLPIRETLRLDLSTRVKIGATAMFLLGLITLITDIVRLVVLIRLEDQGPDVTYNVVDASVWTTVEPAAAIVAVCIPSVRGLVRKAVASTRKTSTPGNSTDRSEGSTHGGNEKKTLGSLGPGKKKSWGMMDSKTSSQKPIWTSFLKSATRSEQGTRWEDDDATTVREDSAAALDLEKNHYLNDLEIEARKKRDSNEIPVVLQTRASHYQRTHGDVMLRLSEDSAEGYEIRQAMRSIDVPMRTSDEPGISALPAVQSSGGDIQINRRSQFQQRIEEEWANRIKYFSLGPTFKQAPAVEQENRGRTTHR